MNLKTGSTLNGGLMSHGGGGRAPSKEGKMPDRGLKNS